MSVDCPLKVGDLVLDCDPYKAPEQFIGYGIVLEVLSSDYVIVHWVEIEHFQAINIGYIKLIE